MKKKHTTTSFIVTLLFLGGMTWGSLSFFDEGPSEAEKQEFVQSGTKAVAVLRNIERTGTIVNDIHQYEFSFEVKSLSGEIIEYSEEKLIDPIYMSSIKMGMEIPAYVSADGDQTLILWEEAGIKNAF